MRARMINGQCHLFFVSFALSRHHPITPNHLLVITARRLTVSKLFSKVSQLTAINNYYAVMYYNT